MLSDLGNLDLIHLFAFYLWLMFFTSTALRIRQYKNILRLLGSAPERWPNLLSLIRQHHGVFLTWQTVLPAVLALALSIAQMIASRLIWPNAHLTLEELIDTGGLSLLVLLFGLAMVGIDLYATFRVGEVDRDSLEGYFDQAEYWLRSWVAPVVRFFTLGRINPRRMVHFEVQKALVATSRLLNTTLWWVSVQVGLRISFGLALWLTWAVTRSG